ncbi:MAG TPA: hypothetical protein VFF06_16410, partial [Polyangia bacterium]|nr:hypothetical protein [Polyangia bacterium]
MQKLAPCLLPLLVAACQGPPARSIMGQLQAGAYALDNAVVIAQSLDHRVFVKHVDAHGRFSLE